MKPVAFLSSFRLRPIIARKSICNNDCDLNNHECPLKKQRQLVFLTKKGFHKSCATKILLIGERERKLEPKVKISSFKNVSVRWHAEQIGATQAYLSEDLGLLEATKIWGRSTQPLRDFYNFLPNNSFLAPF